MLGDIIKKPQNSKSYFILLFTENKNKVAKLQSGVSNKDSKE